MNNIKKGREKIFSKNELQELSIRKPMLAQLELTRNCNQSCIFCFRSCNKKGRFKTLSLKKWIRILDSLWEIGINTVNLSGGEILLFPNLEKFLKEVKLRNFKVILSTNGSKSLLKYIKYIDLVVFSIHGIGFVHDKIVMKDGAFDIAEKHLSEIVKEKKIAVGINTVLVQSNFYMIEKIYKYFSKKYSNLTYHSFAFSIRSNYGRSFDEESVKLNKEKFDYYMKAISQIPESKQEFKHGLGALVKDKRKNKAFISLPDCAGGKYKIVVSYNGDVYPCSFFLSKEYYCGNILKEDLKDIWKNGKGFKPFRKFFLQNRLPTLCKRCSKSGRCFGGCRAYTKTYLLKGRFSNEIDERCIIGNAFVGNRNNN